METEQAEKTNKTVIVRNYGLLPPTDWADDCFEHLCLQNRLWNNLVEIEQGSRATYRAVVGSDDAVAVIDAAIAEIKERLSAMDSQRKELRKDNRKIKGMHTEPLDEAIKQAKAELKERAAEAKAARLAAKERITAAGDDIKNIDLQRKEAVKAARNASGLWWGNYNAVCASYDVSRSRAMKEGAELRFHRFDGSGRFTCQIQGGITTKELLSGASNVVRVRLVDGTTWAEVAGKRPPALLLQEVGSRRDNRQYGMLTITAYTYKDDDGNHARRTIDFPIILHRPLPEGATLKQLVVNRGKVGTDYRWAVTFTFTDQAEPVPVSTAPACGINLGWKQVQGGLRIATVHDDSGLARHIVLPKDVIDRLEYCDGGLQSRIDSSTNDNWTWLLDKWKADDLPDKLVEIRTGMRRAKRPHPARFARAVIVWREQFAEYQPEALQEAETRRKSVKRLTLEHSHLRDKVLRRRQDFYRVETKELAEQYGKIVIDKIDLRRLAILEQADGSPNELHEKARRMRTIAALSEFREWLIKQAVKTGTVVEQAAIESTHICAACGGRMEPAEGLFWQCRVCKTLKDQDVNAAENLYNMAA